jgi:hypothetical protein
MYYAKTHPLRFWLATTLSGVVVILFVASYLLDPTIRARVEAGMNEKLKGYQTAVDHAHLQLLNGTLTLNNVTVIQNAHPQPPVANFPVLSIEIQRRELLTGHIVADLLIANPRLYINLTQLRSERVDKVPFSKKGWQDAVKSVYPFKINQFEIRDGSLSYIDTDAQRPLRLDHLYFTADNIRNTRSRDETNPSPVQAEAVVFHAGKASIIGRANFLAKPFATLAVTYHLENVPLNRFKSELGRVNLNVGSATLSSDGFVNYGPKATAIEVYDARITGGRIEYIHTSATADAENRRLNDVKTQAQAVNNAPKTLLTVDRLNIVESEVAYTTKLRTTAIDSLFRTCGFKWTIYPTISARARRTWSCVECLWVAETPPSVVTFAPKNPALILISISRFETPACRH